MHDPSPDFSKLLELFNFEKKSDLERYCKNLVILRSDFAALILAAQHGVLHPYKYANHFDRKIPSHVIPSKEEHAAIAKNGVGAFKTKAARKFVSKTFHMFDEQRALAAHLFYTPSHEHWYLFYFDNRDTAKNSNHSIVGPHMHLICSLWPRLNMQDTWKKIQSSKLSSSNKIYLKLRD
ncbi:MAG: hypothetical protein WC825_12905 [Gallionellaceae bacterium]|jgi:hypothetical protein